MRPRKWRPGSGGDARPLFVPQDEFTAWAWLPLGVRRDIAIPALGIKSVPGSDRIRFTIGAPALGVTGFRRTHQQALNAQAVALAASPSDHLVTSFAEVAPLALMSGSMELLQAWAERLTLHKNTVQYRVRKAEQRLRRPISQDRLHIELALLVCPA